MSVKKSLIRFGLFAALSILATVVVVSTLINPVSGSSSQYRAVFVNASGLVTGSDVQIAGVRVGRVDSVELVNNQAVVGFELESAQRIPSDGRAVVRYADLLGARTISIEPGQAERATGNYLSPGPQFPWNRLSRRSTSPTSSADSVPCSTHLTPQKSTSLPHRSSRYSKDKVPPSKACWSALLPSPRT